MNESDQVDGWNVFVLLWHDRPLSHAPFSLLWLWLLLTDQQPNILKSDNDLEFYIRQDLEEYHESPMIQDPTTTTWVYFDHRNFDTTQVEEEKIGFSLPFVFDDQGNPLSSEKPDGSFYYFYDHTLQKLIVDSDLGELNSDMSQTVYDFATRALGDCKAAGSTEYFIAFSSHGTGFEGFGGDENTARRRLGDVQTNTDIVSALRSALDDNGIDKFDVIGFDACLMMAYGALDDYKSVSNYFIASEEVEPGHGTFVYSPNRNSWSFGI